MNPKITIITPTYNRAHTLPIAYEGLKKQSFRDFVWIIMDDGSTDNTAKTVEKFLTENLFEIQYFKDRNRHKFLTVLESIRKVKTPYFMILDSDDTYPEDAMEILILEAEKIENQEDFIGIMGLSADENGNIVGDRYPGNGFDGSIFEMRYKHHIKGDKNGIFFTKSYQKEIANKDFSKYENKGYIPQSVIFNCYDAKGLKTRFINKIVRYYLYDEADSASVSNTRWTGKNVYGLREGHLSFLNSYGTKLFSYPKALLRNTVGYEFYSFQQGISARKSMNQINNPLIKTFAAFTMPLSWIYFKLKK